MILACTIMLLAIITHGATSFVSPVTPRLRLVTARGLPHVLPPRRQLTAPSSPGGAAGDSHLRPIVVCGPSGAGKGTLINLLLDACGDGVAFAVSHTTRSPRKGEVDGREYFFTTREAMAAAVDRGEFLEHVDLHGNLYGTSEAAVASVTEQGRVCLLDVDTQGVRSLLASRPSSSASTTSAAGAGAGAGAGASAGAGGPGGGGNSGVLALNPFCVFVRPPSLGVLRARLEARGTETPAQAAGRVATAEAELAWADANGGGVGGSVSGGGDGSSSSSASSSAVESASTGQREAQHAAVERAAARRCFDAVVVNDDLARAAAELARLVAGVHPHLAPRLKELLAAGLARRGHASTSN